MTKKTRRLPYDPSGIGYVSPARTAASPLDLRALRESRGGRHLSYEEGVARAERDMRTGGYDPAGDADLIEQVQKGTFADFANSGMQTGLPFMDEIGSGLNAPLSAIADWWSGRGARYPAKLSPTAGAAGRAFGRAGIALKANGTIATATGKVAAPANAAMRAPPDGPGNGILLQKRKDIELDPPTYPPRSFSADYPHGAETGPDGRLLRDIDGDEITAKYVVGRIRPGEDDNALDTDALDDVVKSIMKSERGYERVPLYMLPEDSVGATYLHDGAPVGIRIFRGLSEKDIYRILAHEGGHVIDETVKRGPAGGAIDTRGIEFDLEENYHSGRTGYRWPIDPADRNMYTPLRTPAGDRYREEQFLQEEVAEAFRTYFTAPNTIKTLWPELAARLRAFAKSHPEVRKIVQFNGLGAAAVLGPEAGGREEREAARQRERS